MTAVDGRELDLTDQALIDPAQFMLTQFREGTAGASMSHLNACRKILADGHAAALVLEDDVTVPANVAAVADAVAEQLTGAEVALLSYDTSNPCQVSREGSVRISTSQVLALPINVRQPRSAGGYIITRDACERMVKAFPPMKVNPDDWWYFYREGIIDRVRCVVPLQIRKTAKLESTLGSYRLGNGIRGRLAWALVQRKIPLLHQLLVYRRQWIYRQWGRAELVNTPFEEKPSRLD
jgi:hypothetical protein